MQKHKNDLISKLEGKTSAMAETLRKLDDKYVNYVIQGAICFGPHKNSYTKGYVKMRALQQ